MVEVFKTCSLGKELQKIDKIEKRCWINVVSPTNEELSYIQDSLNILPNFLRDPLDEEEKPRIDVEDNQVLIIVDIPYVREDDKSLNFETIPLGILILEEYILTICLRDNYIIETFRSKKIKDFFTFMKTRFTLQILFTVAKEYLKYLRHIDKKTYDSEKSLNRSMKNKELFKLLGLEKGLVFFTTSLKSNEVVMEKLLRGKHIKMYEQDQELLEDVIIENRQAIEMANIYTRILSSTMNTFASVISNNLNIAMKFLTSATIVLAIPTMVASFFGMNTRHIPFADNHFAFMYILIFSGVISVVTGYFLYRRGMF